MSEENTGLLWSIRNHLAELHTAWESDPGSDGYHKGNEGYVGVFMYYPNWFEATNYLTDEPEVGCEVYSYLFGPHRLHTFKTLQEAWDEVSKWSYQS